MGDEVIDLSVYLAYFHSSRSSDGAGALGALLILQYFRNCDIKNTGLTLFSVRTILSKLLRVHTYMQLITNFLLNGIE